MKRGDVRSGQVPETMAGLPLEAVLCQLFDLEAARVAELVGAGAVFVDRKRTARTTALRAGQVLSVDVGFVAPRVADLRSAVLYVDRDMIVLDKPAGMPSVPTLTAAAGTLLHAIESQELCVFPPLEVHRLDAPTSGVIVFARRGRAHTGLSSQFAEGKVKKVYLARVHGVPALREGSVDAPLGRDGRNSRKWCVVPPETQGARNATTDYRVLAVHEDAWADLEVRPRTGRTHQIRVHMRHLGLPLWGDHNYGDAERDRLQRTTRLWLHAAELTLTHPVTRRPLTFRASVPASMEGFGVEPVQSGADGTRL